MDTRQFIVRLLAVLVLALAGAPARAEAPRVTTVGGTISALATATKSLKLHPERGSDIYVKYGTETVFKRFDGSLTTAADLAVGVRAYAQGTTAADGSILASLIMLDVHAPVAAAVSGKVVSVNSTAKSFVVHPERGADVLVSTNSATLYKKGDAPAAFADVTVGAPVGVKGVATSGGILAAQVAISLPPSVTVLGVVVGIEAGSLTFLVQPDTGASVSIHADSATQFKKGNAAATFGDLVIGSVVTVTGARNSDASVLAKTVLIRGQQAVETGGQVVSVDTATRSFVLKPDQGSNVTVTTNTATQFKKSDNSAATFADVAVGIRGYVRGLMTTDGSLQAASVIVVIPPVTQLGGTVVSINTVNKSFVLKPERGDNLTVTTNGDTQYSKSNNTAASFTSLTVGGRVVVKGTSTTAGLAAKSVLIYVTQTVPNR